MDAAALGNGCPARVAAASAFDHSLTCTLAALADGQLQAECAAFACKCGHVQWQGPLDFIEHTRAWPATLAAVETIVDERVLQVYNGLKACNPTLTLSGFLDGLLTAATSARPLEVGVPVQQALLQCVDVLDSSAYSLPLLCHATQVHKVINRRGFDNAQHAFSFTMGDLRMGLQLLVDNACAACSEGCNALSVDANLKNNNWDRGREPTRVPHSNDFIADDAAVQLTLAVVDKARVCAVHHALHVCSPHDC